MPQRKSILARDEFYHIFNRGVARMPIFFLRNDYFRFLDMVDYYRFVNTPISFSRLKSLPVEVRRGLLYQLKKNSLEVEILTFCLMNNHYHFLVKQISENGITKWMSNIQNGYAKYYNLKRQRVGPLFQSRFKAVRIETDEQLLHVSRYIHLNPTTSYVVAPNKLISYEWASLAWYIENRNAFPFINKESILTLVKGRENYKKFIFDQVSYQRELSLIKHLTLE